MSSQNTYFGLNIQKHVICLIVKFTISTIHCYSTCTFSNTIDSDHSGGISSEAIVGIAVGGSAAIIIVIIIAISCFAYKKKGNI